MRYGLGGQHPLTFDELGRMFSVTWERIRRIEKQAIKQLQTLRETQSLREHV